MKIAYAGLDLLSPVLDTLISMGENIVGVFTCDVDNEFEFNTHVIRTAEMVDLECIVFVRGKKPTSDIIEMAEENGMVLLCTDHTLYCTSGILYSNGLTGVGRRRK